MKKMPLQMLMVTMGDGRRGVFIGSPIVSLSEDEESDEYNVNQIVFSHVNELPMEATLGEVIELTDLQARFTDSVVH